MATRRVGEVEAAVLKAVDASGLMDDPRNSGAVAIALSYARQIDDSERASSEDRTKALYLGPHLLKTLMTLGLTPGAPSDDVPKTRGRPKRNKAVMDGLRAINGGLEASG